MMEILEAFDLVGTLRGAAVLSGRIGADCARIRRRGASVSTRCCRRHRARHEL
jgi:hypothetical protein